MKARRQREVRSVQPAQGFGTGGGCWVLAFLLWLAGIQGSRGQALCMDTPAGFFTDAANRLLANAGYAFGVTNIQVWPINFYTPSVHRLLQVAANLYDATTDQAIRGAPGLPSVFRPLFGCGALGTNICIVGYVEATNASMAGLGPEPIPFMRDLTSARDRAALLSGSPDNMVWGTPAVVGAKKGLLNFNEFSMETTIQLTRRLEFRRPDANPAGPVNQTNQMLLLCISNVFGMEAWNSYLAAYPRDLRVYGAVDSFATVSNEFGTALMSNVTLRPVLPTDIPQNSWLGYAANGAFKLPLDPATNGYTMLNATYLESSGQFINATTLFERGLGFPVPHWWLSLRTRLLFILVDTTVSPNRIVDYANLDAMEPPVDITLTAQTNGVCGTPWIPGGSPGSLWCTNRAEPYVFSTPYGVLNQIGISLGNVESDVNAGRWNNAANGAGSASTTENAIDFFRGQLYNIAPSKTNTFYAPYEPTRTIFYETSWQANDPLVHYTVPDLTSPAQATNAVQVDMRGVASTLSNLGRLNGRYQPWASGPGGTYSGNVLDTYNLALKDPMVTKSDDWNFPAYNMLNPGWLGRVHRGTPWQTIYLKSTPVDYPHWLQWSGNAQIVTNWGQISPSVVALYNTNLGTNIVQSDAMAHDALFTHPTNDWRLVSLLAPLFNTNDPRSLVSVSQSGASAWASVLDGLPVLTNVSSSQYDTVVMSSNSIQAGIIASALDKCRTNWPGGRFRNVGDTLVTPELSVASPWLAHGTNSPEDQITDAAYEALPAQLLMRLRPDSFGFALRYGGTARVQFTGADAYAYAVQVSSNLVDWTSVSTNFPKNGFFQYIDTLAPVSPPRFYRTVLLPCR